MSTDKKHVRRPLFEASSDYNLTTEQRQIVERLLQGVVVELSPRQGLLYESARPNLAQLVSDLARQFYLPEYLTEATASPKTRRKHTSAGASSAAAAAASAAAAGSSAPQGSAGAAPSPAAPVPAPTPPSKDTADMEEELVRQALDLRTDLVMDTEGSSSLGALLIHTLYPTDGTGAWHIFDGPRLDRALYTIRREESLRLKNKADAAREKMNKDIEAYRALPDVPNDKIEEAIGIARELLNTVLKPAIGYLREVLKGKFFNYADGDFLLRCREAYVKEFLTGERFQVKQPWRPLPFALKKIEIPKVGSFTPELEDVTNLDTVTLRHPADAYIFGNSIGRDASTYLPNKDKSIRSLSAQFVKAVSVIPSSDLAKLEALAPGEFETLKDLGNDSILVGASKDGLTAIKGKSRPAPSKGKAQPRKKRASAAAQAASSATSAATPAAAQAQATAAAATRPREKRTSAAAQAASAQPATAVPASAPPSSPGSSAKPTGGPTSQAAPAATPQRVAKSPPATASSPTGPPPVSTPTPKRRATPIPPAQAKSLAQNLSPVELRMKVAQAITVLRDSSVEPLIQQQQKDVAVQLASDAASKEYGGKSTKEIAQIIAARPNMAMAADLKNLNLADPSLSPERAATALMFGLALASSTDNPHKEASSASVMRKAREGDPLLTDDEFLASLVYHHYRAARSSPDNLSAGFLKKAKEENDLIARGEIDRRGAEDIVKFNNKLLSIGGKIPHPPSHQAVEEYKKVTQFLATAADDPDNDFNGEEWSGAIARRAELLKKHPDLPHLALGEATSAFYPSPASIPYSITPLPLVQSRVKDMARELEVELKKGTPSDRPTRKVSDSYSQLKGLVDKDLQLEPTVKKGAEAVLKKVEQEYPKIADAETLKGAALQAPPVLDLSNVTLETVKDSLGASTLSELAAPRVGMKTDIFKSESDDLEEVIEAAKKKLESEQDLNDRRITLLSIADLMEEAAEERIGAGEIDEDDLRETLEALSEYDDDELQSAVDPETPDYEAIEALITIATLKERGVDIEIEPEEKEAEDEAEELPDLDSEPEPEDTPDDESPEVSDEPLSEPEIEPIPEPEPEPVPEPDEEDESASDEDVDEDPGDDTADDVDALSMELEGGFTVQDVLNMKQRSEADPAFAGISEETLGGVAQALGKEGFTKLLGKVGVPTLRKTWASLSFGKSSNMRKPELVNGLIDAFFEPSSVQAASREIGADIQLEAAEMALDEPFEVLTKYSGEALFGYLVTVGREGVINLLDNLGDEDFVEIVDRATLDSGDRSLANFLKMVGATEGPHAVPTGKGISKRGRIGNLVDNLRVGYTYSTDPITAKGSERTPEALYYALRNLKDELGIIKKDSDLKGAKRRSEIRSKEKEIKTAGTDFMKSLRPYIKKVKEYTKQGPATSVEVQAATEQYEEIHSLAIEQFSNYGSSFDKKKLEEEIKKALDRDVPAGVDPVMMILAAAHYYIQVTEQRRATASSAPPSTPESESSPIPESDPEPTENQEATAPKPEPAPAPPPPEPKETPPSAPKPSAAKPATTKPAKAKPSARPQDLKGGLLDLAKAAEESSPEPEPEPESDPEPEPPAPKKSKKPKEPKKKKVSRGPLTKDEREEERILLDDVKGGNFLAARDLSERTDYYQLSPLPGIYSNLLAFGIGGAYRYIFPAPPEDGGYLSISIKKYYEDLFEIPEGKTSRLRVVRAAEVPTGFGLLKSYSRTGLDPITKIPGFKKGKLEHVPRRPKRTKD